MTVAGVHRLTPADLRELADPEGGAELARRLRAVELSKHKLLLEQVRKRIRRERPGETRAAFESLRDRLITVENTHPELVARVLATPHLGAWTAQTLMALDAGHEPDIAYFATLVAAACERAGRRFVITLPINSGPLNLPGVGTVRVSDGRVRVTEPVYLRAETDGLVLEASLDLGDPQLARCGLRGTSLAEPEVAAWRKAVQDAWDELVRFSRPAAAAVAAAVGTIVPMEPAPDGLPTGATSGWAFGAIGLALAPTPEAFAEGLLHEARHVLLGGVMDLVALTRPTGRRYYSPWREDPRPIDGLLQGCYAFLSVTAFWRARRHVGSAWERRRGDMAFHRWRRAGLEAVRTMAESDELTPVGRVLVEEMRRHLDGWRDEPVAAEAEAEAESVLRGHRERWLARYG